MLARTIGAPASRTRSGVRPLTVAWVPTGMKAGVSTVPCGVCRRPARAEDAASRASSSKWTGAGYGRTSSSAGRAAGARAGHRLPRAAGCVPDAGSVRHSFLSFRSSSRELLADLVERGDAEVLAFQQLVAGVDEQLADGLDAELGHALAGADREVQVADRLGQQRPSLPARAPRSARARSVAGGALAAFEGHAEAEALGGHHLLDFVERGLAEVLAGQQGRLGRPGQVAERPDVHLPQAVAAADRELEVGDGDLQELAAGRS